MNRFSKEEKRRGILDPQQGTGGEKKSILSLKSGRARREGFAVVRWVGGLEKRK